MVICVVHLVGLGHCFVECVGVFDLLLKGSWSLMHYGLFLCWFVFSESDYSTNNLLNFNK